eukprot:12898768-Prorocentrum_lima.AAC.1
MARDSSASLLQDRRGKPRPTQSMYILLHTYISCTHGPSLRAKGARQSEWRQHAVPGACILLSGRPRTAL